MPPKRYLRSRTDKVLSGVCGGLAAYFDVDPTLVRLAWVLVTVFTGFFPGVVAYVVLVLVAPEEPAVPEAASAPAPPPP